MIAQPWRLQARLGAPRVLDGASALRTIFPEADRERIEALRLDLLRNEAFFAALNAGLVGERRRRVVCDEWKETLYVLVRLLRPRVMIETGVFDGESSAIILQAMEDGGEGRLVSIDLPATETIAGSTQCMREVSLPPGRLPGWAIPGSLGHRHTLHLGDSRTILPQVLADQPAIDCFFHDSRHTSEHMLFEYRTAWPHLAPGGVLLSDDIDWNGAFHTFCRETRRPYMRTAGGRLGITRRPKGSGTQGS